jgi:S-DNA-T family DNA segregation ATPase FtsK/SpoIIIE
LVLIFWAVFLFLALLSYHSLDPSINQVVSRGHETHNLTGLVGSYTAGLLVDLFGVGSLFWPFLCLYLGLYSFFPRFQMHWWRWAGVVGLVVFAMALTEYDWARDAFNIGHIRGGGFLGGILHQWSRFLLRPLGAGIFWFFVFAVCVQLVSGMTWGGFARKAWWTAREFWYKHKERLLRRFRQPKLSQGPESEEDRAPQAQRSVAQQAGAPVAGSAAVKNAAREKPERQPSSAAKPKRSAAATLRISRGIRGSKKQPSCPPLDLLDDKQSEGGQADMRRLKEAGKDLEACLGEFGVSGEVTAIVPGPVVTMFEFKPAPGIKISKITGLSDDVALALRAQAVRIEAVGGKDTVGIEVANDERQTVYLREILSDPVFKNLDSRLALAMGKNIRGEPVAEDLTSMPHLLVGGATGKGKSVCLNAFLLSILYKSDPSQVKLLLIDPKRIEFSVYADLPHLVHPVVTEMEMAKSALEWAVCEMEKRYDAMAGLGVRHIDKFNLKLAKWRKEGKEEAEGFDFLPYLVIVIDELADLMMTAGKDAEMSIVRLAQLARAAGMHLVIATQRPSVDVVTGLIKANFPTRIALATTSRHDSRTILDTVGAEYLLGRGDSLYKPSGGRLTRIHGPFVSEEEICSVVEYWRQQCHQEFELDFREWQQDSGGGAGGDNGGPLDDPLYDQAVEFAMEQGQASISGIQRRFRIGFNRAARFIEQMETDGLLGPQEGSKPRKVIK